MSLQSRLFPASNGLCESQGMCLQKISLIFLRNEKVRIVLSLDTGLEEREMERGKKRKTCEGRVENQRTSVEVF